MVTVKQSERIAHFASLGCVVRPLRFVDGNLQSFPRPRICGYVFRLQRGLDRIQAATFISAMFGGRSYVPCYRVTGHGMPDDFRMVFGFVSREKL